MFSISKDLRDAVLALGDVEILVCAMRDHGRCLDVTEVAEALALVGRNDGPYVLTLAYDLGAVSVAALRAHLGPVWSAAEYPEAVMPQAQWVRYFRRAGFTIDGRRADRPTDPLTLYRGAPEQRRGGMAWTDDPAVARRFALDQLRGREVGRVWKAAVPPVQLLAVLHDRDESEYVIDPRGVDITPAD